MPFSAMTIGIIALILLSAIYFFMFYQKHILGVGAEPRKIDVRILNKQAIELANPMQEEEMLQYWIYVQPLKGGPKREFEVGVHFYDALQPGDRGTMTYQGMQFMHFAKLQAI